MTPVKRTVRKGSERSRQCETALEEIDLGPFASYWRAMLTAIMKLSLAGNPTLRDLVKNAIPGAKEAMQEDGLDPNDPAHPPPWRHVKEFIIKVLTLAGAVRTDGDQQIVRSTKAGLTVVRRVDPACRLLVLAELVFALVSKLGDVNEADKADLAFALLHAADDEEIAAIEEALGYLIEASRIHEEARDGRIYYKVNQDSGPPSVRIATPPAESA